MDKRIITLTGPTCSGKSTLAGIMSRICGFAEIVSTTTRPKRTGEIDGNHYNFISMDEFNEKAMAGEFVESVEFNNQKYGASRAEFEKAFDKGPVVVVVEPDGAAQIREYSKNAGWNHTAVYIDNPLNDLMSRFLLRFSEDKNASIYGYADRLEEMVTTGIHWRDVMSYDFVVEEYNELNRMSTAEVMLAIANGSMEINAAA